jgi:hypothetical protein
VGTSGGTTGISNECHQVNFLPRSDINGNLNCSQIYDNWKGNCGKDDSSGVSIGYCATVDDHIFQYNFTIAPYNVPPYTIPGTLHDIGSLVGKFKLVVKGNEKANGLWTTSDANYKTLVGELDKPLDRVLELKGVHYYWDKANNPDMNFDDGVHTGFIAQEVEQVIPHVVITQNMAAEGEEEKLRKSVNYIELIPYLVESIKALNEKITGLEAQIQCLNESTGCNGTTTNKTNTTSTLENTKIISVSPNPSNDVVTVSLSIEKSVQTATLNVYDLNGKLLNSLNINDRSTNITKTLQRDNFGAGVYIVSLIVNGKSIDSKKIVFN